MKRKRSKIAVRGSELALIVEIEGTPKGSPDERRTKNGYGQQQPREIFICLSNEIFSLNKKINYYIINSLSGWFPHHWSSNNSNLVNDTVIRENYCEILKTEARNKKTAEAQWLMQREREKRFLWLGCGGLVLVLNISKIIPGSCNSIPFLRWWVFLSNLGTRTYLISKKRSKKLKRFKLFRTFQRATTKRDEAHSRAGVCGSSKDLR